MVLGNVVTLLWLACARLAALQARRAGFRAGARRFRRRSPLQRLVFQRRPLRLLPLQHERQQQSRRKSCRGAGRSGPGRESPAHGACSRTRPSISAADTPRPIAHAANPAGHAARGIAIASSSGGQDGGGEHGRCGGRDAPDSAGMDRRGPDREPRDGDHRQTQPREAPGHRMPPPVGRAGRSRTPRAIAAASSRPAAQARSSAMRSMPAAIAGNSADAPVVRPARSRCRRPAPAAPRRQAGAFRIPGIPRRRAQHGQMRSAQGERQRRALYGHFACGVRKSQHLAGGRRNRTETPPADDAGRAYRRKTEGQQRQSEPPHAAGNKHRQQRHADEPAGRAARQAEQRRQRVEQGKQPFRPQQERRPGDDRARQRPQQRAPEAVEEKRWNAGRARTPDGGPDHEARGKKPSRDARKRRRASPCRPRTPPWRAPARAAESHARRSGTREAASPRLPLRRRPRPPSAGTRARPRAWLQARRPARI